MTKPYELMEAEMICNLAESLSALPEPGALLDQPVWLLRSYAIRGMAEERTAPAMQPPVTGLEGLPLELTDG